MISICKNNLENKERIEEKIRSKQFDDEIEGYIYNLTGEEIARKIADSIGIDEVYSRLLPEDKAKILEILELITSKSVRSFIFLILFY